MQIKVKKQITTGQIIRLQAEGEVKEVVMHEDILKPGKELIAVCFRGENAAGIIELTHEEAEELSQSLQAEIKFSKGTEIFRELNLLTESMAKKHESKMNASKKKRK